jgi:hypothetical protein
LKIAGRGRSSGLAGGQNSLHFLVILPLCG